MATDCIPQVAFGFEKRVVAKFDAAHTSTDGGAVLLKALDRQLGVTAAVASCLRDHRQPGNLGFQGGQPARRPWSCRRRARASGRKDEILFRLVVEGHEPEQRQIARRVVVPVEERELLLAVGGVVGGIEVDRAVPSPAAASPRQCPGASWLAGEGIAAFHREWERLNVSL